QELIPALLDRPVLLPSDLHGPLNRGDALPELAELIVDLGLEDVRRRSRILRSLEPLLEHSQAVLVALLLHVELRERELRVLLEADRQIRLLENPFVSGDRFVVLVLVDVNVRVEVMHLRGLVAVQVANATELLQLLLRAVVVILLDALLGFGEALINHLAHRRRLPRLLLPLTSLGVLRQDVSGADEQNARHRELSGTQRNPKLSHHSRTPLHCHAAQRSSTNVILLRTPGTSTGSPLMTRGLYLNFAAASIAGLSKIGFVDSTTRMSFVVPVRVTVNSTITYPSRPRCAARCG